MSKPSLSETSDWGRWHGHASRVGQRKWGSLFWRHQVTRPPKMATHRFKDLLLTELGLWHPVPWFTRDFPVQNKGSANSFSNSPLCLVQRKSSQFFPRPCPPHHHNCCEPITTMYTSSHKSEATIRRTSSMDLGMVCLL